MRKIISILVALGVILGLTLVAAVPVAADACVCPTGSSPVTITDALGPPSFCAGEISNYLIGTGAASEWPIPITMLGNTDSYVMEFPAGTDLSGVTAAGVTITSANAGVAIATSISVVGTTLFVKVPAAWVTVAPNDFVQIQVNGVINTATPDTYCLNVGYMDDCCDVTLTDCGTFTVVPNICTLDFVFDFDLTYTGIAEGFIPPFKACGQEDFGTLNGTAWVTDFELYINPVVPGCHPECPAAKWFFLVTAVEPGGVISFFDGVTLWTLTELDIGDVLDPLTHKVIDPALALLDPCAALGPYPMWIHFSTPGDYEITFYLECPSVQCGAGKAIIADEPLPAKVYQWKEASKIPLYRKWNLISLPLVPLEDPNPIEHVLAAYQHEADIVSVHYYDACAGIWKVYGPGQTSLATMEDGKSYWVLVDYSHTDLSKAPGLAHDGMWVWGNAKPVPPNSPSAYPVCTGWNMVGLTGYDDGASFPPFGAGLGTTTDWAYLWNWFGLIYPEWGVIFGWDAAAPQAWFSVLPTVGPSPLPVLQTGEGYWIDFSHDGFVYPP